MPEPERTLSDAVIPCLPCIWRETHRLLDYLRGFDETRWARATLCPGWNAARIIGHMTGGTIFYTDIVEAACRGETIIPFGARNVEEFEAYREEIVRQTLEMPGAERVAHLEAASRRMLEVFSSVRPEDLDRQVWHRKGTTTVSYYTNQRLYEIVLHHRDIRNEPDSPLPEEAAGPMAAMLEERFALALARAETISLEGRFRFETREPPIEWTTEIREGKAFSRPGGDGSVDAEISAPAGDLVLLATGRADARAREDAGTLHIRGDHAKAEAIMEILFRSY